MFTYMTTIEILNGYRFNDLDLKYKCGSLDDETREKIRTIEQIFADDSSFRYPADSIKIVCMYYKKRMMGEQIAEMMDISPRTVYRKRDEGVQRLLVSKTSPHSIT